MKKNTQKTTKRNNKLKLDLGYCLNKIISNRLEELINDSLLQIIQTDLKKNKKASKSKKANKKIKTDVVETSKLPAHS